ncbi:MAG: effector binding domain-containing protein [Oscillospiraceae bacterium]
MEWLTAIRTALEYMEKDITAVTGPEEVAENVHISTMYLQRGFQIMTGFTIGEYIRNRRLYLAAVDLANTNEKVIDIALRYGYETPESFTKAFSRFHGAAPSQVRSGQAVFRTFLPLRISITVQGGSQMDFKVAKMFPFKVIGFQKEFSFEEAYAEIPKFWDEICEKYAQNVYMGNPPANAYEKALMDNCIGEYGVCIDDIGNGKLRYLIAGKYSGGEVPEGMEVYEFPMGEWAMFDCIGAMPEALQSLNTRIFKEWLPGNPDYEISGNASVEWYDCINGEKTDPDYHSAIWIPVKKKQ